MTALQKLWFNKQKATIRNLFRKPSSAIFMILIILFYGITFISSLFFKEEVAKSATLDVHTTVMIILGFTAMMMLFTLMSSRKALFYEDDAFYLFSGPFSKKQQMKY